MEKASSNIQVVRRELTVLQMAQERETEGDLQNM